jgi:O-acetyl-ADP-ribose deacetylase (regulator of RNase III)
MTHIINSDLIGVERGVICHQVNCRKVAGAGVALQIRRRWPQWYAEFQRRSPKLGQVGYHQVDENLTIADLYAQDGFGRDRQYTDYEALRACLQEVRRYAGKKSVYLPFGMSSGLAGGDWNEVLRMIEAELPEAIIVWKTR